MHDVQRRILSLWPDLRARKASEVLSQIRRVLYEAFGNDLLRPEHGEINDHVKLERSVKDPRDFLIIGGIKDFSRRPESARLRRNDGAWLHFTMTLRQIDRGELLMLGYDFEIVFPNGYSPSWVRFDLNLPDHPNEERELRCHVHPGNDDVLVPAPVMSPAEILGLFIHQLRPRDSNNPRSV